MNILETKNLTLNINGSKILDNVTMSIKEKQIYALVGPNGAGKSSLAFAIMGLDEYTEFEGDILFKGKSIKNLSVYERAKKGITLAWQEPARFEGLTVRQFIKSAGSGENDEYPSSVLQKVGMTPSRYLERAMDTGLSGGERKKIELASILTMEPELVLLDEPDSGIDVESLDRIFEGIELLKERGSTVVLITHSATVLRQAEYAYLMCRGAVIDEGKTDEVSRYFEEKCISCDHKNVPDLKGEA